ncbi:NADPH-dependent ferric siderophore reductase [Prauserella sediminis]|uniref:NADPH-dependent ferric siderophore reductase n=1 Tax=Prauserella sediminis TaxID=577680 RepID=A0A839XGC3_9PSEU|nr:siderophore-interacting protein [Prauserella sediminis]MBB3661811.1 NADPH-dependent ferric siderophore reductase [Prauserella sediminis]
MTVTAQSHAAPTAAPAPTAPSPTAPSPGTHDPAAPDSTVQDTEATTSSATRAGTTHAEVTTTPARPQFAFRRLTVSATRELTPHLVRVTFTGDDLDGFVTAAPDQYVKVFFPHSGRTRPDLPPPIEGDTTSWYRTYLAMPDDVRPPMRTYTVRAFRPEQCELDIDFVLHPDGGPASTWASGARPGDEIALMGPHGIYAVPDSATWQLLVGDESAIPAIAAILEQLPRDACARVFIEVGDPADRLNLPSPAADVDVRWIVRHPGSYGDAVLDAVRAADFPATTPYAWLAGEAELVKFARRHLVRDRGVDKRAVTFTGYWRKGRSEEEVGRENLAGSTATSTSTATSASASASAS